MGGQGFKLMYSLPERAKNVGKAGHADNQSGKVKDLPTGQP
jgi:hypothetical protein